MKKILKITKWEYVEKVKTKAFILSMIIMPLFIIAMAALPTLIMNRSETKSKIIGVIDQGNIIADEFAKKLESDFKLSDGKPVYIIKNISKDSALSLEQMVSIADKMVFDGKIENYIVVNKNIMTNCKGEYRGTNVGNIKDLEIFQRTIRSVIAEEKLAQKGIDPNILKEVNKPVELKAIKISKEGEAKESGFLQTFFTSYVFIILLMLMIIMTGQLLIRSLVEEKSNRVIEILVSSCSPTQLMAGKILGLSALGLTQMISYILIGIAASVAFSFNVITLDNLFLIFIYFLLGYIFYAAIFVAVGSMASTEQEAQQLTSYVSMFLVLPIALAFVAIQEPDAPLIKILSFIPFLTPSFMVLRIPIQVPPLWEVVTTILILLLSTIAMIWIAGKIFRIGILMYGKAPKIKELIRWIRTK
jgi:ABC-2 type transport system permease protein